MWFWRRLKCEKLTVHLLILILNELILIYISKNIFHKFPQCQLLLEDKGYFYCLNARKKDHFTIIFVNHVLKKIEKKLTGPSPLFCLFLPLVTTCGSSKSLSSSFSGLKLDIHYHKYLNIFGHKNEMYIIVQAKILIYYLKLQHAIGYIM